MCQLTFWHCSPMGVTPQQFEQMKKRITRPPVRINTRSDPNPSSGSHEVIIGIDPSLRGTGFGVIRLAKPFPATLAQGTIQCPETWEHSRCLVKILQTLREVVQCHRPTVCAIEGLFFELWPSSSFCFGKRRAQTLCMHPGDSKTKA